MPEIIPYNHVNTLSWAGAATRAMSCRVFWSTDNHFSPHYYYLKGLLFCFWLILQPPGDRNHDVGLGQAWPAWWLRSSCILLVLPSQIFYTTHQWLPLASDNKFHSKWSKMLLLDSSRKINHLCNIFNDLLGQFALNWMKKNSTHINWSIFGAKWKHISLDRRRRCRLTVMLSDSIIWSTPNGVRHKPSQT